MYLSTSSFWFSSVSCTTLRLNKMVSSCRGTAEDNTKHSILLLTSEVAECILKGNKKFMPNFGIRIVPRGQ